MVNYRQVQEWQWYHNTLASDMIRIFLGVALFVRGLLFLLNPDSLLALTQQQDLGLLAYYVMFAHVAGGLLLAVGLWTRVAALIQIPILFGAVFRIHIREGLFTPTQSLELAALVLFLLILFFVIGPGKTSLDYHRFASGSAPKAS